MKIVKRIGMLIFIMSGLSVIFMHAADDIYSPSAETKNDSPMFIELKMRKFLDDGFALLQDQYKDINSLDEYLATHIKEDSLDSEQAAQQAKKSIALHCKDRFLMNLKHAITYKEPLQSIKDPVFIFVMNYKNSFMAGYIKEWINDYNFDYDLQTLLCSAIIHENTEMFNFLIELGADPNLVDKYTPTYPLSLAVERNNQDAVKTLIALGADMTILGANDDTLLHKAAYADFDAMIKLLIQHGADVNARNDFGETALFKAAQYNKLKAAQALLAQGAHVNIADFEGVTPEKKAKTAEMKALFEGYRIK